MKRRAIKPFSLQNSFVRTCKNAFACEFDRQKREKKNELNSTGFSSFFFFISPAVSIGSLTFVCHVLMMQPVFFCVFGSFCFLQRKRPMNESLVAAFNINSGYLVAPFLHLSDARELRSVCRSTAFLARNDEFYAAVRVRNFVRL